MKKLLLTLLVLPLLTACGGPALVAGATVIGAGLAINHENDPTPCTDAKSCAKEIKDGVKKGFGVQ